MTEFSSSLGWRMDWTSVAKPTRGAVRPRAIMTGVDGDLLSGVEVLEWASGGVDGGVDTRGAGARVTVIYS